MIIMLAIVFFIYKKKPKSEAMELEPADSEHIIFKKEKRDLLKHHMNLEIKNKRRIYKEFDKIAEKSQTDQNMDQGKKTLLNCELHNQYLFILKMFFSRSA